MTGMAKITGLEISNFKGVGNPKGLDQPGLKVGFKPITLLFGSNSAGKSSILQALQYAGQIFLNRNIDARKIGDQASDTDIGGFANFVHNQELRRDVVIGVQIRLEEGESLPYFGYNTPENVDEPASLYESVKDLAVRVKIRWDWNKQAPFVHLYEVIANGKRLAKCIHRSGRKELEIVVETDHPIFTKGADHSALELWRHPEYHDDPEEYAAEPDESVFVNLLRVANSVGAIKIDPTMASEPGFLKALHKDPNLEKLLSGKSFWVPVEDDALPDFANPLPLKLEADVMLEDEEYAAGGFAKMARYLREALSQLVIGPAILVRRALSSARFLGQFREVPERDHVRGRVEGDGFWSNGVAAWNMLARPDRKALVETVSQWLSESDKLDCGYLLRVKEYKEVDIANVLVRLLMQNKNIEDFSNIEWFVKEAKTQLAQLTTKVRVLFTPCSKGNPRDEVELAPKDLGVGISQMVPVVVAALDSSKTLVAVEQPELHLHPRLQARMGDLFIKGMKAGNRFLLETHSEHLINRFQRRIRELTNKSEENPLADLGLSPEDLAIWHVSSCDGEAVAKQIKLDADGNFTESWPDDFFDISFKERFSC